MTPDPHHRYTARDGRVYDEDGVETGTARTANGRDLERFDAALQIARKQREAERRKEIPMSENVEKDRLFVNAERTVLVRIWASGTVEVARRDDPSHTWGPPVYLEEER